MSPPNQTFQPHNLMNLIDQSVHYQPEIIIPASDSNYPDGYEPYIIGGIDFLNNVLNNISGRYTGTIRLSIIRENHIFREVCIHVSHDPNLLTPPIVPFDLTQYIETYSDDPITFTNYHDARIILQLS